MTVYEIPILILLSLLGACLASFSNASALRMTQGKSFTKGRSECPQCGGTLRWFELIPVLSWIIQAGTCRNCKERVSPRYLIVEIIGAAASALCYIKFGLTLMMPIAFITAAILLAIALVDIGKMEIPNALVIALIPTAVLAIWAQPGITLIERGIGFFTASLPMLILALIIKGAFGGGDIKLMAVCGFLLGWQSTVLAFFIAVFLAGIYSITMLLRKKAGKKAHIAFGPYLCLGVTVSMIYGSELIYRYLSLYGIYI